MRLVKKKILLIDDDSAILEAMKLALEAEDYIIEDYPNGECIDLLTPATVPQLVLTDMLLDGSRGGDVITKLKNIEFTKNIPIVMLSAHPNAAVYAKEHGADGFLEKPFDIEDLLSTIKRHII